MIDWIAEEIQVRQAHGFLDRPWFLVRQVAFSY